MSVIHPVVTVSNMEMAFTFYRDLLGLTVTSDEVHEPKMAEELTGFKDPDIRAVILEAPDGSEVELVEFRRPKGRQRVISDWPDAGINSITFQVSDLDQTVQDLAKSGIRFRTDVVRQTRVDGGVVKVVYCEGPDGVIITLGQLPSEGAAARRSGGSPS